jgi:RHS repeat-associated protein
VAGNVTTYTYDALNQLTQAVQKNGSGGTSASYAYGYDPVGNRTSHSINGTATSFSHNAADQLTGASGGVSSTYTHDNNGNLTSVSGGNSFAYNPLDQTTGITPSGKAAISQGYTGTGQTERTSAGSTNYQYDETGLGSSVTGTANTYFTKGPDGEFISGRLSTGTYYYLFDGLGSVVGLTDSSGNVVNTYTYDPYGNTTSVSETVSNPFRFIGAEWDSSTGLYKMGERYYDPTIGRFTQPDPLDGQTYTYAGNNPVNFVDPAGLYSIACPACFGPGGGAASAVSPAVANGIGALLASLVGVIAFSSDEGPHTHKKHHQQKASPYPETELVKDILKKKKGSIKDAPLAPGSPDWDEVSKMTWGQIEEGARQNKPGFKTLRKLLTQGEYNK